MVDVIQLVINFLFTQGPQILFAIIVLVAGLWVAGFISRFTFKRLQKQGVDPSLRYFLKGLIRIALQVLTIVTAASMIGIATTSFVAIIGAAGLAVGLALQGSLANFAGGVLILVLKPFKVDEFIEGGSVLGTVEKIEIFYTHVRKLDNVLVIVPNGQLSNNTITNYSRLDQRRMDFTIGVSYDDDIKKVQKTLTDIAKKDKRILKDPQSFVRLTNLGDSSVDFTVRLWAKIDEYWDVKHDYIENVKLRFDKEGISFPFPQRDVHLIKE